MIAETRTAARTETKTSEEDEALLERASAPTLRDLRVAAQSILAALLTESDSALAEIVRADCRSCLPECGN